MNAGRFIERWLGKQSNEEIRRILEERDASCFRPKDATPVSIESKRRRDILSALRRGATSALIALCCLFIGTGSLRAENAGEMAAALRSAADTDGPFLIEAII